MSMSEGLSISFYTLIKLCYTKALSDRGSSLAPDQIPLLWRHESWGHSRLSATTFHRVGEGTETSY